MWKTSFSFQTRFQSSFVLRWGCSFQSPRLDSFVYVILLTNRTEMGYFLGQIFLLKPVVCLCKGSCFGTSVREKLIVRWGIGGFTGLLIAPCLHCRKWTDLQSAEGHIDSLHSCVVRMKGGDEEQSCWLTEVNRDTLLHCVKCFFPLIFKRKKRLADRPLPSVFCPQTQNVASSVSV